MGGTCRTWNEADLARMAFATGNRRGGSAERKSFRRPISMLTTRRVRGIPRHPREEHNG